MKKKLALLLACTMALGLTACGGSKPAAAPETTAAATEAAAESSEESKADEKTEAAGGDMDALIEAAKAEGELTVYGSCEEEYLSAACQNFEKLYGIKKNTRDFLLQKFTPRFLKKLESLQQMYGSAEPWILTTKQLQLVCWNHMTRSTL